MVVRGPKGINALFLVRLGNHIDALVKSALTPLGSLGAVDCGVNYVLERKGVKEQDGLTDLMRVSYLVRV